MEVCTLSCSICPLRDHAVPLLPINSPPPSLSFALLCRLILPSSLLVSLTAMLAQALYPARAHPTLPAAAGISLDLSSPSTLLTSCYLET